MKYSTSLEQACCVLGIIAKYEGKPVTNAELNRLMDVSLSYLMKITRKLVVAGLIRSSHGVNGGYVLAKPMSEIRLSMVVDAIEGDGPFFSPSGVIERVFMHQRTAAKKGVSLLEEAFADAERAWRAKLEKTSMQHVIQGALSERNEN